MSKTPGDPPWDPPKPPILTIFGVFGVILSDFERFWTPAGGPARVFGVSTPRISGFSIDFWGFSINLGVLGPPFSPLFGGSTWGLCPENRGFSSKFTNSGPTGAGAFPPGGASASKKALFAPNPLGILGLWVFQEFPLQLHRWCPWRRVAPGPV